jgi:hypothetical protein
MSLLTIICAKIEGQAIGVLMMDFPYNQEQEIENERETYLNTWHRQEKTSERMGAILMVFGSVLSLVLERLSVDSPEYKSITLTISIALLSGGITLLFRSRRPREERLALQFLRYEKQVRYAAFAGMGAVLLFFQGGGRPLMMIGGGLLVMLALWFQWRSIKIRHFDALFVQATKTRDLDE